jgi:hypothetical protein
MQEGTRERHEPEEEAATEGRRRPPVGEESSDPSISDPSPETEVTEEDRDNPLVNDSSFNDDQRGSGA